MGELMGMGELVGVGVGGDAILKTGGGGRFTILKTGGGGKTPSGMSICISTLGCFLDGVTPEFPRGGQLRRDLVGLGSFWGGGVAIGAMGRSTTEVGVEEQIPQESGVGEGEEKRGGVGVDARQWLGTPLVLLKTSLTKPTSRTFFLSVLFLFCFSCSFL